MAVTTESSDQIDNQDASPPVRLNTYELGGRLRIALFSFTQGAAAGDANSTVDLVKLPPGKTITILKDLCRINHSAFGAGRTLDIGAVAHVDNDGDTVAADVDELLDGADVSSAGNIPMGTGTGAVGTSNVLVIDTRSAVKIQAICLGDTLPAGATLNGFFVYVED